MIIQKSFSHISYTLEDDEYSKLALKMISGAAAHNIIKPVTTMNNGRKRFMYSVRDLTQISLLSSEMDEKQAMHVLSSYKDVLNRIEAQTFLKKDFLELDTDRVFVDVKTGDVKFIIVPVMTHDNSGGHRSFLKKNYDFISAVLDKLQLYEDSRLCFMHDMCLCISGMKDDNPGILCELKDLYTYLISEFDIEADADINQEDKRYIESSQNELKEKDNKAIREIELHYDGDYGTFTFYITKNSFTIGKAPDNDGALSMNPAVSRYHLVIEIDGDKAYVTDLNSSNHTFINRMIIPANQKVLLEDQRVLRIANMDFEVRIST